MTRPKQARPEMLAADHIRQLVEPFTTTEAGPRMVPIPTTLGPAHPTAWAHDPAGGIQPVAVTHRALLDQVADSGTRSTGAGEDFHAAYESKPAGRMDCIAFLARLGEQSHALAREHGLPRLPLRDRLSALSGVIGSEPHPVPRAWWVTARVLTQHDGPPFAPPVPCQVESCERRGTLRIRLEERMASCVECHTVWDDTDETGPYAYGRLVLWVEWAAEHLTGPRHWLTDADGFPVECTECVGTRRLMAQRANARAARQHRHATARPVKVAS